jgi:uncharacterized membrane protein
MHRSPARPLFGAGVLLGIGLGGFADVIVLHNLLQWHHIVCLTPDCRPADVAALSRMVYLDGIFYVLAWLVTLGGAVALFWAMKRPGADRSSRLFGWSVVVGWGIFHILDSLINHYLLHFHHIRPGPDQAQWDIGFLLLGIVLVIMGWLMARTGGAEKSS